MSTQPTRPEIDFPGDEPPTELVVEDITVGEGAEATPGSTVSAHYVGVAHSPVRSSTRRGTGAHPWTSGSGRGWSSQAGTPESPA